MNYNHNEYEDETFIIIVIRACYNSVSLTLNCIINP